MGCEVGDVVALNAEEAQPSPRRNDGLLDWVFCDDDNERFGRREKVYRCGVDGGEVDDLRTTSALKIRGSIHASIEKQ